jgi:NAD(P)-dependent dehydrogenase (short-subunit alcohol dehydrogenase family)
MEARPVLGDVFSRPSTKAVRYVAAVLTVSTIASAIALIEEVAAAILFWGSDDASYVTGALLFVDGGMTAM